MQRLIKTIVRVGRESDAWPIALVLVAVLVPAGCLLWFMNAALRNERYAARQILADARRAQLSASRARIQEHWQQTTAELERLSRAHPPAVAFARCVQSGLVDSVVLFDERGRATYPNEPLPPVPADLDPRWEQGNALEHRRRDYSAAAKVYSALAVDATNVNHKARALQGQARCLHQAGAKREAIQIITDVLGGEQYRQAVDPQGRLIVANAELMALELIEDHGVFQTVALRLQQRLTDYENTALAAPQRRFLMKQLQKISRAEFPTLAAEELAAAFCDRGAVAGTWQFTTPNRRVAALLAESKLLSQVVATTRESGIDAEITLVPPGKESPANLVSIDLGDPLPGWRLAISPGDPTRLDMLVKHRTAIYIWQGVLLVTVTGVLAFLAVRILRRQAALTRLKNDLAATVSHELKTPLTSMRVLVDTLLDTEKLQEQTVREYLQLVAKENTRLQRLIDNFLTFSRIERNKYRFNFVPVPAEKIVEAAVAAVSERFNVPGCQFEVHAAPELPMVLADSDALVTALSNILDNAWKYSGDIKRIVLRAVPDGGNVMFSVEDNGIGIPPREKKRIFKSFYQCDQRLSRDAGGCGLGLSIVHFIAHSHGGNVRVESQPGRGSIFTLVIPAASAAVAARKEAVG